MPFEINTLQQTQAQTVGTPEGARVAAARTEKTKTETETGKTSAGETVSLTDTAAKLQQITAEIEAMPVVDSERVEPIKRAIDNGTYNVDPARIADRMLAFESDLV